MGWIDVNLHDGSTVKLYKQEFANECGPSCVATISRIFGRIGDIALVRRTIGDVDHHHPPSGGRHDWHLDWAYMESLTQALSQRGFRMVRTRKDLAPNEYKQFCERKYLMSPAILRVAWADGSGHFVVTVGKNRSLVQDFIEILDPAFGYQRVSLINFPAYAPRDAVTGIVVANGTLDRFWSVETN
jgi:hypothetical protein